jgi:hypothetical protein
LALEPIFFLKNMSDFRASIASSIDWQDRHNMKI